MKRAASRLAADLAALKAAGVLDRVTKIGDVELVVFAPSQEPGDSDLRRRFEAERKQREKEREDEILYAAS